MSTFIAKWNDCGRLRRFKVSGESDDELYDSLLGQMAAVAPHFDSQNAQLTYTDSDGDQIVFSSGAELGDAISRLDGPRRVLRISTPETEQNSPRDQRNGETQGKALTPSTGIQNAAKEAGRPGAGRKGSAINTELRQKLQARNVHLRQQVEKLGELLQKQGNRVRVQVVPVSGAEPAHETPKAPKHPLQIQNANLRQQVQRLRARLHGGATAPAQKGIAKQQGAATRKPPVVAKPQMAKVLRIRSMDGAAEGATARGRPQRLVGVIAVRPVSAPPKVLNTDKQPQDPLLARNARLRQQVQMLRAQLVGKPVEKAVAQKRRAHQTAEKTADSDAQQPKFNNVIQEHNAKLRQQVQMLRAQVMGKSAKAKQQQAPKKSKAADDALKPKLNAMQERNARLRQQVQRLRAQLHGGNRVTTVDKKPENSTDKPQKPLQARNARLKQQVERLRAQLGRPTTQRPAGDRKAGPEVAAPTAEPRKVHAATAVGKNNAEKPQNALQARNARLRQQVQQLRAQLGLPLKTPMSGAKVVASEDETATGGRRQNRTAARNQAVSDGEITRPANVQRPRKVQMRQRMVEHLPARMEKKKEESAEQAEKSGETRVTATGPKKAPAALDRHTLQQRNQKLRQQVQRLRAELYGGKPEKKQAALGAQSQPPAAKPKAQDIRANNPPKQQVERLRKRELHSAEKWPVEGKQADPDEQNKKGNMQEERIRARNAHLRQQVQKLRAQLMGGEKKKKMADAPKTPNNAQKPQLREQNVKLRQRIQNLQAKLQEAKSAKEVEISPKGEKEMMQTVEC